LTWKKSQNTGNTTRVEGLCTGKDGIADTPSFVYFAPAMQPIASYIDYTALSPAMTSADIDTLCDTSLIQGYAAVCVPPYFLAQAVARVQGSTVRACSVVGFPHGLHLPEAKLAETRLLVELGAHELDMVINLSALRSGDQESLRQEVAGFQELCAAWRVTSKVIIESGLLTYDEISLLCQLCAEEEVDFVKTSTGFAAVGAEIDKVAHMREVLPAHIQIKAAGGIRSYDSARAFIDAGATRIGTSTLIIDP
jgi:deoxyribose-phosphate aldolase